MTAQNVTLNFRNTPLKEVLREIQNQTDYRFVYNDDAIGASNPISISVTAQPLRTVLTDLFAQNNIAYEFRDRQIVLKPQSPEESETIENYATTPQQITGRVICSATGETLPFVTVRIKGTVQEQ